MDSTKIIAIFEETVTDKAIKAIEMKHTDLVHDFTNEAEFKQGRKIRTEMNKMIEAIDRVGIDAALQVTEVRNKLKNKIEEAYSGTVAPWEVENEKRKAIAKAKKEAAKKELREQKDKLSRIKGSASRALHLSVDEIDDILQDVMSIDVESFKDDELRSEARFAKDASLAQLQDAMKFATQKEEMRKAQELKDAELMDKNDEIAKLKAQLASANPQEKVSAPSEPFGANTLDDALSGWSVKWGIIEPALNDLKEEIEMYTSLTITEQ